jgi:uncharacterized DUF497 family protein
MEVEKGSLKFQWDIGNFEKNYHKHGVRQFQVEQLFFNEPLYLFVDIAHSNTEKRYIALGHDDLFNLLFISFVIRDGMIRVVSARTMSKKEKTRYEKNI